MTLRATGEKTHSSFDGAFCSIHATTGKWKFGFPVHWQADMENADQKLDSGTSIGIEAVRFLPRRVSA